MSDVGTFDHSTTLQIFCPSISQTHIFKKNQKNPNSKVSNLYFSPTHSSATEDFVGYTYTFAFTTLYSVHCTAFGEI